MDGVTPLNFHDPTIGLKFIAPSGWIAQPVDSSTADSSLLSLLDPEGTAAVVIWIKRARIDRSEINHQLEIDMNEHIKQRSGIFRDYQVRAGSAQIGRIGENQSVSWVANYVDRDHKMVDYQTFVRTENTKAQFIAIVQHPTLTNFARSLTESSQQ